MVEWLEVPVNHKIIVGESTSGKSVAHGVGVTTIEGFRRMAAYVHTATLAHMSSTGVYDAALAQGWTGATCQSRWKSYFGRYKTTRDKLNNQTGFGISTEMAAQGVTLEAMIKKVCPYYDRIYKIFGKQSTVEPSAHTAVPEVKEDDEYWFGGGERRCCQPYW
ncbi:hypothetical protein DVH05_020234 [Phytophthora capsici]|nr:hypothetical protein DVH05_020234 [Phytophthora capsici]